VLPTILVSIALAAGGSGGDREAVVSGLQSWLDGTQTLEMEFRQSLVSGALGTTTTERGRLYLERPGKLRWDYADPDKKTALLIDDRTELYLQDERTLYRGRLSADQGLFPRLLAGRDRIEAFFAASIVTASTAGPRGLVRLKLVPKADHAALTEVTLALRAPAFGIEAAEVLDETGNRTTYTFSNVRRNRPLPEGVFAFEPPPGTQIESER
jgi:outer membrane lipoprotein carrier protein